jgi:dTMP kinase
VFISIDGGDGVGKSTQVALLCHWLEQSGHSVVRCRDPGSTRLGEMVRELLLNRHDLQLCRRSEMLLYMAARAQLAEEIIGPALRQGKIVVSDRYLLANVVYQGYGGGLDVEALWHVGELATGGLMPDLTLVLDMPAEAALARIARTHDRMEQQGLEFHRCVREGFLAEARRRPDVIVVIDAARSPEAVQADIRAAVQSRLGRKG